MSLDACSRVACSVSVEVIRLASLGSPCFLFSFALACHDSPSPLGRVWTSTFGVSTASGWTEVIMAKQFDSGDRICTSCGHANAFLKQVREQPHTIERGRFGIELQRMWGEAFLFQLANEHVRLAIGFRRRESRRRNTSRSPNLYWLCHVRASNRQMTRPDAGPGSCISGYPWRSLPEIWRSSAQGW